MRFSEYLRRQADPIFEAIFAHPFVRGIASGNLSREQLVHYVRQDFQYLNVFCQMYGLGIAKSTTREDMAFFHQRMEFILQSETHPHHNFAHVAGYKLEDLEEGELLPTARNYTRHMLHVAHSGSIGELLAVLLPCPLTYWEIGIRLQQEVEPDDSHPFKPWIGFYADHGSEEIKESFLGRLDAYADQAHEAEKARMEDHYLTSCRMEYMFWDMAYNLETWPV